MGTTTVPSTMKMPTTAISRYVERRPWPRTDRLQPHPGSLCRRMDHSMPERTAELARRRDQAIHAGSEKAVARQHARGKMTARERVEYLLDDGSFTELDLLVRHHATGAGMDERPYTDGVITGWGTVEGRQVFLFSQDFTVFGGSLGEAFAEKVHKVMDLAASVGAPLVGLNDGAGARIQEGVASLVGYGEIFRRNTRSSGRIPQISVIMGPCAGGAVYSPALTDFVFMVEDSSYMFITGPDVVKTVTGEDVGLQELGGAITHGTRSGVAHFTAPDDKACLDDVRRLLGFLPSNNGEAPPRAVHTTDPADRPTPELETVLPPNLHGHYDMKRVITAVVDGGQLYEYSPLWARNIVCGLARIDGWPVGIVANQPQVLAGVLDIDASEKAARFVRTCDAFNIPLVAFVDVPGFLPGTDQELGGIIRHGAKLLYAFCEATVPRIQVVTRKAFGGAYVVMNSKSVGADLALAWPSAELSVMGPQGVVEILHRRELDEAAERSAGDRSALRTKLTEEYAERFANPWMAAERGFIDAVIEPTETRAAVARGLDMLRSKQAVRPHRKHGNVPL